MYSSSLHLAQAKEAALKAAPFDSRLLEEATLVLRRVIMSSFMSSDGLPWPPPPGNVISESISQSFTNGQLVASKHLISP